MKLGKMEIEKIADEIPHVGLMKYYILDDDLVEYTEWLHVNTEGIYKVVETGEIFFISDFQILVDSEKPYAESFIATMEENFGKSKSREEYDDGPFGGAFASDMDYYNWRFGPGFVTD